MATNPPRVIKVMVLGEPGVGKTGRKLHHSAVVVGSLQTGYAVRNRYWVPNSAWLCKPAVCMLLRAWRERPKHAVV